MSDRSQVSSAPEITICIPTYNRSGYLREAIEYACNQRTERNLEILVVDNASTDDTPQVVAAIADSRVCYVRNPENLGMVGNFNRCLDLARGQYIATWSDDDLFHPDLIETQATLLDRNPNVGMAYTAHYTADGDGKMLYDLIPFPQPHIWPGVRELKYLSRNCYFNQPLLRRRHLDRVGRFNPAISHAFDWDMWMRFTLVGDVGYINQTLVGFRFHLEQASAQVDQLGINLVRDWCSALESTFARAPQEPPYRSMLHNGYCEIGQRNLWHIIHLLQTRRYRMAWRHAGTTVYALKRAGWRIVPYSVRDARQFLHKRRTGQLQYLFVSEDDQ